MPDVLAQIYYFNVKLNGAQASQAIMDDLLDCTVESTLNMPDMCTLRFNDNQLAWTDSETFSPGLAVSVEAKPEGGDYVVLFAGEITAIEPDLAGQGAITLLIRCLDFSHRLHRGRQTRTFQNSKDSDLVSQLAAEAGLTPDADETEVVHDWLMQTNQTNWEFLSQRAAYNNRRLYVTGDKTLHFASVAEVGPAATTVTFMDDLMSFRPRIAASPQVDQVTVRGWDPQQKEAIIGQSREPIGLPHIDAESFSLAAQRTSYISGFGAAPSAICDRPIWSQSEAEALAQSAFDETVSDYLHAEGLCVGNPAIMAGKAISVAKAGQRLSGTYFVTSVVHTYSQAENYTTHFSVTGKRPTSLLGTMDGSRLIDRTSLGYGIVVGIVTDNKDDLNQGRVKVQYPWLSDSDSSWWARIASPMAGDSRGFYFLPEINDEVLVAFEHGDIRRPYVLGALWNGQDSPPEGNDVAVSDSQVVHRIIKTRVGHTVLLDDTEGTGSITLTTAGGHTVTLDDKNQKIVISDTPGNKITIDSNANSMKLECLQDFTISAQGQVSIQGQTGVSISTPMQFSASGDAGASLQSTAQTQVSGAQVQVQGDGEVQVSAPAIMIGP